MDYSKHFNLRQTPQSEAVPGKDQVLNTAGGYVFQLDPWKQLDRFLVLGTEGGTYYTEEHPLTVENAKMVLELLKLDGLRVVTQIVAISDSGRAPKNDPALFALALAASHGDLATRQAAFEALPKVARIPTHLFHFVQFMKTQRGFGRAAKRAIANWYLGKPVDQLAYQVVKYRQRDGWTHRDLLRLSHPKAGANEQHNQLLNWITHPEKFGGTLNVGRAALPTVVAAFEAVQHAPPETWVNYAKIGDLSWEMFPTEALTKPEVWRALLDADAVPHTALMRNLGRLSSLGVLKPPEPSLVQVVDRLTSVEAIKKARVHPYNVLVAAVTFANGRGVKGSLTWDVIPQVNSALEYAFNQSFVNVEPTGKAFFLGVDVSGSMGAAFGGGVLTCRTAAAAMGLITARTEKNYAVYAFDNGGSHGHFKSGIKSLPVTAQTTLPDMVRLMSTWAGGATDCSLPMLYAMQAGLAVDAFLVYTDNETWAGDIHPYQALDMYRQKSGRAAKLIVVGMTSTGFSIADPKDPGMLDVVGFDAAVPKLIGDFVRD